MGVGTCTVVSVLFALRRAECMLRSCESVTWYRLWRVSFARALASQRRHADRRRLEALAATSPKKALAWACALSAHATQRVALAHGGRSASPSPWQARGAVGVNHPSCGKQWGEAQEQPKDGVDTRRESHGNIAFSTPLLDVGRISVRALFLDLAPRVARKLGTAPAACRPMHNSADCTGAYRTPCHEQQFLTRVGSWQGCTAAHGVELADATWRGGVAFGGLKRLGVRPSGGGWAGIVPKGFRIRLLGRP